MEAMQKVAMGVKAAVAAEQAGAETAALAVRAELLALATAMQHRVRPPTAALTVARPMVDAVPAVAVQKMPMVPMVANPLHTAATQMLQTSKKLAAPSQATQHAVAPPKLQVQIALVMLMHPTQPKADLRKQLTEPKWVVPKQKVSLKLEVLMRPTQLRAAILT